MTATEIQALIESWEAEAQSNSKIDIHPRFYADGISDDLQALKKQLISEFVTSLLVAAFVTSLSGAAE